MTQDYNRRALTIQQPAIEEALPEYFQTDNSKLVTLIEKYYDFLDSDGKHAFGTSIRDLHHVRDVAETSQLDELIKEIGNGLQSAAFFKEPRLMAKLLASFYRSKGSLVSVEGFFRGFFGEEVEVEYSKDQIFIVGESNIGFDSQRFIQNNELYQIFSILLKVGLSTQDYETLYKRFVHPAGFFFAGQVLSVGEGDASLSAPFTINPIDSAALNPIFASEAAALAVGTLTEFTNIIESDGTELRVGVGNSISTYADSALDSSVTVTMLNNFYGSIMELVTPNSFTFDDSATSDRPDFSMTLETMDAEMFTRYTANILDSSI